MASRRDEINRAIIEASHVADENPLGARTSFDILGVILRLDIPVMCASLDGLLGAAISAHGMRGILLSTQRPLHIQRFTLAHELGHILLDHRDSFDSDVGFSGRFAGPDRRTQEVAADTFASELLGAKRVMFPIAQKHGWLGPAIRRPENIYQLSLRLGLSFHATCWSLLSAEAFHHRNEVEALVKRTKVRALKRALDPEGLLEDSWADVWDIGLDDADTEIEAGPNDLFAINLQDYAASGFLWHLADEGTGAEIVGETIRPLRETRYGDPSSRVIFVRFNEVGNHLLHFEHRRPWTAAVERTLSVRVVNFGKEENGIPRRFRQEALESM